MAEKTETVSVASSLPVQEELEKSVVVLRDNAPEKAAFDRRSQSYVFTLPYLYVKQKFDRDIIYALLPPSLSSKVAKDVAEEIGCKALSDPDLTYRFLLCRTTLVDPK